MKITNLKVAKTRNLLLGGVLLLGGGAGLAVAQARQAPRDPAAMPEFRGTVAQYDLSPRGNVDGLILADGTEVRFPPHLGAEVRAVVRPGDAVTVRGERSGPVLRAGSVAGPTGNAVVDRGPPAGGPRPGEGPADGAAPRAMEAAGTVKMPLHGPRGDLNGALLEDGTIVRLPPKEASRLAASLKPGQVVAVRGEGVENAAGRVIGARAFGPSMGQLTPLAVPPPPPAGKGPAGPAKEAPPLPVPPAG